MNVNHNGQAFLLHLLQSEPSVQPRQQAKIAASSDRHTVSSEAERGEGKFRHRTGRRLKTKWPARRPRHSVTVMMDGINTGIICESQLGQNVERPYGTINHRVSWCAIPSHSLAGDLLNDVLGAPRVFAKFRRLQFVDQSVPV